MDLWDTLSSQTSIEVETNCCDDVYLSVLFMIFQIKDHIFNNLVTAAGRVQDRLMFKELKIQMKKIELKM